MTNQYLLAQQRIFIKHCDKLSSMLQNAARKNIYLFIQK